ncbi:ADP-ribosylation factor 5-like [Argonauta hians]
MGVPLSCRGGSAGHLLGGPSKVLMVGPTKAGKTHLLYSWLLGQQAVVSTHPTLEFNVEKIITRDGRIFLVWDISGCERFRPKRRHFLEGTQAIVFVIDSAKPLQLKLAKLDLWEILQENELKSCPLLVIANKQDNKESLPVENVSAEMGLSNIQDRIWSIIAISALETEGVDKALRELCRLLDEHRASMP